MKFDSLKSQLLGVPMILLFCLMFGLAQSSSHGYPELQMSIDQLQNLDLHFIHESRSIFNNQTLSSYNNNGSSSSNNNNNNNNRHKRSSNYCSPTSSPNWHSLHSEALELDQEISQSLKRLKTKSAVALPELETFVRQKNLGWQAAGFTSVIGRILDEYSDSADNTENGETLTPSGFYKNIINVASLSILQGAYVASVLYKVEDLTEATSCGPYNVDMVSSRYSKLFHLESLYQDIGYQDLVENHPQVLMLLADEFAEEMKESLSCMTRRGDFLPGETVSLEVDRLVLAIKTRLEINEELIDF